MCSIPLFFPNVQVLNEYIIGRSKKTAHITVDDGYISGNHCRIYCEKVSAFSSLKVIIQDLSSNGTYIRTPAKNMILLDKKEKRQIHSGDEILMLGVYKPSSGIPRDVVERATFMFWGKYPLFPHAVIPLPLSFISFLSLIYFPYRIFIIFCNISYCLYVYIYPPFIFYLAYSFLT